VVRTNLFLRLPVTTPVCASQVVERLSHGLIRSWRRTFNSWQQIVDLQQAGPVLVENQTIRLCHFGAHRVAAEDHPWIKDRELADGPVELSTFNGQVLPALRARQFEPGLNLLPELIR
jgi:hypothetical protein